MPEPDLSRMMDRTRSDPFFIGHALDTWQKRHGFDDVRLAEALACDVARLPQLFLCRMPSRADPEFESHVLQIAGYVPCNESKLLEVISHEE